MAKQHNPTDVRRPRLWRAAALLAVLLWVPVAAGCIAAAAAAGVGGAAVYYSGKISEVVDADLKPVFEAAVATIEELGLPVLIDRYDALTLTVESEYADGKHVWIIGELTADNRTDLSVRVGVVGDTDRARKILEGIKDRLSK